MPTIHCSLNAPNTTVLQADCDLTYAGHNLYLITYFRQDLLQGHKLDIPDTDSNTGMSPLLTPCYPLSQWICSNTQGGFKYCWRWGRNTSPRKGMVSFWINGCTWWRQPRNYITTLMNFCRWQDITWAEGPLIRTMATQPHHIELFKRQCDKECYVKNFFGA